MALQLFQASVLSEIPMEKIIKNNLPATIISSDMVLSVHKRSINEGMKCQLVSSPLLLSIISNPAYHLISFQRFGF